MKVIVTDKQKKLIRGYVRKWRDILFLQQWAFGTEYHNDIEKKGVVITMQPEYKNAVISINVSVLKDCEKDELEEIIVHELCHAIVQPLVHIAVEASMGRQASQSEIDWHKECVTQHFARAIYYFK